MQIGTYPTLYSFHFRSHSIWHGCMTKSIQLQLGISLWPSFLSRGTRTFLRLDTFSEDRDFSRKFTHTRIRGWNCDVVSRNICGDSNRCNENLQGFCDYTKQRERERKFERDSREIEVDVSTRYSNLPSTTSWRISRYEIVSSTCLRNAPIKLSSTFPSLSLIPSLFVCLEVTCVKSNGS